MLPDDESASRSCKRGNPIASTTSSSMTHHEQQDTPPIEKGTPMLLPKRQQVRWVILGTILLAILYFIPWIMNFIDSVGTTDNIEARTSSSSSAAAVTMARNSKRYNSNGDQLCSTVCDQYNEKVTELRKKKRTDHGTDQSTTVGPTTRHMIKLVRDAQEKLISKLKMDYGDIYFQRIFVNDDDDNNKNKYRPFMPISPTGPSMGRLKQKLMIKALTVQTLLKEHYGDTFHVDGCDCIQHQPTRGKMTELDDTNEEVYTDVDDGAIPLFGHYVWATGGHSAAAGHGNLFNESYTAFLERDMKDVFRSIGIEFEGRNYAMGGTSSSAEVAMCWEQIFGNDVDFFTWDYGMTDGNYAERLLHYGYRGGLSSSIPAILGVHMSGRRRPQREDALRTLESMGMAAFYGNDESYAAMRDAIPDMAGLSMDDIQQIPEYVRNFKCGGAIEKGEPFCDTEKYTKNICVRRSRQAGWHPGM
jgi:hypothetical protein